MGVDEHSATWRTIAAWAEKELAVNRARLEVIGTSLETTENLRGRVAMLKELLAMPKRVTTPDADAAG